MIRGTGWNSQRGAASTILNADAGTMDVEAVLDAQPPPAIPRLQPQKVETIETSNAD